MTGKKYCGTAAKAGGNGENKPRPKVMGVPRLLENLLRSQVCSLLFYTVLKDLEAIGICLRPFI